MGNEINQNNKLKVIRNRLQILGKMKQKTANEMVRSVLNELATLDPKRELIVESLPKGDKFLNQIGQTVIS